MSLESYKKTLDSQKERIISRTLNDRYADGFRKTTIDTSCEKNESLNLIDGGNSSNYSTYSTFTESESKTRNRKIKSLIFFILILSVLVVAAIKNPSETESNIMVKDYIVQKVNEKFREEMTNEENDGFKQFGAFLGMTFSSNLIDYVAETSVNNYIIFSTFDCYTNITDSPKTVLSGLIIFGKIIPLHTDIDPQKLNIKK